MLSQKLKELRREKKISQKELSEILFVSQQAVAKWELGKTEPNTETLKKIASYFDVSVDSLIGKKTIDIFSIPGIKKIERKKFSMLGVIACGEPLYCEQEFETYIEASADIKADICLTAKGDSMVNARIYDGDIVFIRKQDTVENGEIAAVIIDDEATLKRVYRTDNSISLVAENPKYAPLVYTSSDCCDIRILGKAVAFQSLVK